MSMLSVTPELLVEDVQTTIAWYQKTFEFTVLFLSPPTGTPTFARIKNGDTEIMLFRRAEFAHEIPGFATMPTGGSFVLYLEVNDIQSYWDGVKDGATVVQSLHTTDYSTREFTILDCNGYHLMLNEKEGNEQS